MVKSGWIRRGTAAWGEAGYSPALPMRKAATGVNEKAFNGPVLALLCRSKPRSTRPSQCSGSRSRRARARQRSLPLLLQARWLLVCYLRRLAYTGRRQ